MSLRIGFVGLGNMGTQMANNLGRYAASQSPPLPPLTIWNRSPEKYAAVSTDNPKAHFVQGKDAGPEEVVKRSDVVFTCLLNDAVADEVYSRMIAAVGNSRCIFVDHSSLNPKTAGESRRCDSLKSFSISMYISARPQPRSRH
jgi:3-hydroxyisobutyrate dehydrogenase-like beta-hydroxyacid dehydrogenase